MYYLLLKWLHIIAIISWMAGILYLYRLFVYHVERGAEQEEIHTLLLLMERRLYRFITQPAMVISWLAGLGMIYLNPYMLKSGWLHWKLLLVVGLTAATQYAGLLWQNFHQRRKPYLSGRTLRILNEVPTLLMMAIVAMVIFRPL